MEDYIKSNIESVKERVEKSAAVSGRKLEDITIVAVCKTVTSAEVLKAYDGGMRVFGENRVQSLTQKLSELSGNNSIPDIKWHIIGHLQTNKIKYIVDKVDMIHSVDSLHLADEINRQAEAKNIKANCLLQFNVAKEESKFGIAVEEARKYIEYIIALKNIDLKGFMTMAPLGASEIELRKIFSTLRKIYIDMNTEYMHNISMSILSMGMSDDYTYAIEEGSNTVRIGRAIFSDTYKRF